MNKERKKGRRGRQIEESIERFLKLTNECGVDIFLQQKIRDLTFKFSKNMNILEHTHTSPPSNKLVSITCTDSNTCLYVADNWL